MSEQDIDAGNMKPLGGDATPVAPLGLPAAGKAAEEPPLTWREALAIALLIALYSPFSSSRITGSFSFPQSS